MKAHYMVLDIKTYIYIYIYINDSFWTSDQKQNVTYMIHIIHTQIYTRKFGAWFKHDISNYEYL